MSVQRQPPTSQYSHASNPSLVETLHQKDVTTNSQAQPEAPLPQVLERLGRVVHYCGATVQLEDHGVLWIVAQKGYDFPEGMSLRHPVAEDELYQTVAQTKKPLVVPNMQQDPRRLLHAEMSHVQAWIGAPLLAHDQVIGLITVGNDQPNTYSDRDAEIVAAFASQATTIVEQARLTQRLIRSERLYQTLQDVVALINSTLDLDQVLNEILKQLERILPYDSASIHLLHGNRLFYAAGRGFPVDSHPETKLSSGENVIFRQIGQTQQAMVIGDVRQHPDWHIKPGLEYIRSWIGAPLIAKERVIGYLTLDHSQAGAYTEEDAQITDTFARQVVVAIENARLYTETRRWAEEQAALNTVATAASSSLNLHKMLNHALDAVQKLFDADVVEVRLLAESGGALNVAARRTRPASTALPPSTSGNNYALLSLRENRPVVVPESNSAQPAEDEDKPGESVAALPLRSKERLLGSLSVISYTHHQFTPREISLLEAISNQLSLAVENARLYEQLKESEARKTSLLHELEKSLQELQQAQAKLVQSEKLAAIGQLVSGVAHELNNPLTSIIGYAQLLQSADLDTSAKTDLNRIVEQAQRSARIVQNLLTFGRQHKPERQFADVNRLIEETLDLVSYQLTMDHIVVERRLSGDIPPLWVDPNQLQQVWLNLIQNAQQAMIDSHKGGTLRVRSFVTDEGKVRIEFSDNGPGIAPDVVEKIFDPFFTTKPVGKGTGLGLSICYGIIQEHEGQIWGENNPKGGATFIVELPVKAGDPSWLRPPKTLARWPPEPASAPEMQAKQAQAPTDTPAIARVLVVDDESTILELINRLLTRQGYDVDTVGNGAQAVERVAQKDYDVVLLDILMPQKGGIATYQEIIKLRPDLASRVIFATGDLATGDTQTFLKETQVPCIAKPFDLDELTRAIQSVLEQGKK